MRASNLQRAFIVAVAAVLVSACSSDTGPSMPKPVMSEAEVQRLEREAVTFADSHMGAWPDVDAFVADLAEDTTMTDPTWGDHRQGRAGIIYMWRQMSAYADFEIDVTAVYLSADGAAYEEAWPGLQPPMPLPPDPPLARGLTVYGFRDGETVSFELWYPVEDNTAYGVGCFAAEEGCPALRQTVDRYVDAWSSREPDAVAARYSDDAVFTHSMLGLEVEGADAIGDLAEVRFGSTGDLTMQVLDFFVWTEGPLPPTDAEPDRGRVIGVAIHYRVNADDDGVAEMQEGITTLVLGTRYETHIEADPQDLIHDEKVYHDPTSLLAAVAKTPEATTTAGSSETVAAGTITISVEGWSGVEGYRLLAGVWDGSDIVGGAFWTHIDSDPFSGEDVVHPPALADGGFESWGEGDYVWEDTARLEPGTYRIDLWANPGELEPYGSHVPTSPERTCWVDVVVSAGEVSTVVITDIPVGYNPCPEAGF
jgi:ketosteroid isomerase-like protein